MTWNQLLWSDSSPTRRVPALLWLPITLLTHLKCSTTELPWVACVPHQSDPQHQENSKLKLFFLLFKGMCHGHKSPSVCTEMLQWCGRDTLEPSFMVGGLRCLVRGQASLCMPQAAGRPLCYWKSRSSLGWKGKECSLSGELVGLSTRRFFNPQMINLTNVGIVQPQHRGACLHISHRHIFMRSSPFCKMFQVVLWPRHITNTLSPG